MSQIKLLILDVDGVMTTGALPYNAAGNDIKAFFVQDGSAIRLWQQAGGVTAIISGRKSPAVQARAKDLGIDSVLQGVADKLPAYRSICRRNDVNDEQVGMVGDDLLDLAPMRLCGYPIAVANAHRYVKRVARYITRRCGGQGAVSEAVERLLRHNGDYERIMAPWSV